MLGQIGTIEQPLRRPIPSRFASHSDDDPSDLPQLYREQNWRCLPPIDLDDAAGTAVIASRWTDKRSTVRREHATSSDERYVISLALQSTRVRLTRNGGHVFEGSMPAGMLQVTAPGEPLSAEFHAPCDFIHLHVATDYIRDCQEPTVAAPCRAKKELNDFMVCDPVAAQLARTLTEARGVEHRRYAESVGQTIVLRLLALRPSPPRTGALAKWRLRRVQEFVARSLEKRVSLVELAAAAGLSRMHFAAQFRAATGCRPHEYLLQQRIEESKVALLSGTISIAQIALSVGFQTQSHFSTVFKRMTGATPATWQRASREAGEMSRSKSDAGRSSEG